MACIYTYKGKQYSEQEIKDIVFKEKVKPEDIKFATLDDIANILAYSNSKIILDGYKVEYSTPLGNKYETLEEVNNEIRGLVDSSVDVDLNNINIKNNTYDDLTIDDLPSNFNFLGKDYYKIKDRWKEDDSYIANVVTESYVLDQYKKFLNENKTIQKFIEKNKEYEQSKEIIEEWKKENNIQYDPEEVYSRGQGFYSSIGAYSNLELDLLLKNLIQHIEDNKKAGGEFTISAFTKPIDRRLKHIEGTGDRVRFVIYPKSEHIKWAAPTDVYSGSVWDANTKVSTDKKSELLGVSYTKSPSLNNVNKISPNLSEIIDSLEHAHNELAIELTEDNFEIEFDENIDYSTKQLINSINKIIQQKRLQSIENKINQLEKQCN